MAAKSLQLYKMYLDELGEKERKALLTLGEDMERAIEKGRNTDEIARYYSSLSGRDAAELFLTLIRRLQDDEGDTLWMGWHFWVGSYARCAASVIALRALKYATLYIVLGILGFITLALLPSLLGGWRLLILVLCVFLLIWGLNDFVRNIFSWREFNGTGWPELPAADDNP